MKKLFTVIALLLGLSFSVSGHAKKLSLSESREVLLSGETIASGYDERLRIALRWKGELVYCVMEDEEEYKCWVED
ncbi:hypothetical protein N8Z26_04250 [Burkholderiales bacterium]|nr:hypothetical protein [Burkholderiales bacterium]